MTTPVRYLDDTILVERHLFGLMDLDVASCPSPWPRGTMPPELDVWTQRNRVDLRSVGEDHEAAVRLEAWSGPPVPPDGSWEADDEVEVVFTSAQVRLWTLTSGPSESTFRIGPSDHGYGLRVWCQGRQEVLELAHEDREIPDGTERYVLQFRPLRPLPG